MGKKVAITCFGLLSIVSCGRSDSSSEGQPVAVAETPAATRSPKRPVSVGQLDKRDIQQHVPGSRNSEIAALITRAAARVPESTRAEFVARLEDPNVIIVNHPDSGVAAEISKLYRIRALDAAAISLENSREAARGRTAPATLVVSRDPQFSGGAATILRKAGGGGRSVIVLHHDVTTNDLASAFAALQTVRALEGDLVLEDQKILVEGRSGHGLPAKDEARYTRYLKRLQEATVAEVPGVGRTRALTIRMAKIAAK